MPLKHGKGKEAFSHNVKAEMDAGKPQDQALAIAYSVKRKAKSKKMAEGGKLQALDRPSTIPFYEGEHKHVTGNGQEYDKKKYPHQPDEQSYKMHKMNKNTGEYEMHGPKDNGLKGLAEGGRVKSTPIKHPKMVDGILKTRRMDDIDDAEQAKLRKDEEHLESSAAPRKMAEGGEVSFDRESRPTIHDKGYDRREISDMGNRPTRGSGSSDMDSAESARLSSHASREMGEGPEEDRDPDMSPIRESYMRPSEDEYMADHFADGGIAEEDPHDNEMEDEHDSSIAAAIMAREKRMAEGGEILERSNRRDIHSHGSTDSDSSSQADLSRNADEDANEEDQQSYDSLRKENYSEEDGLSDLTQPDDSNEMSDDREMERHDENDRVGAIMRKMSRKR